MTTSMKNEIVARMRECPLFLGLSGAVMQTILDGPGAGLCRVKRGTLLFSKRAFDRKIGLMIRGTAEVRKGGVIMSTLRPGEIFGAVTLYSEESYYVTTITAASDVLVLFFNGAYMDAILEEHAEIAKNYIAYLTKRIYFLNRKIDGFTSQGTKKKLALFLRDGLEGENKAVRLPFSLTKLAERLNVSRASLYRAFGELEESGILSRTGKQITVHHPEKLELYC